jgi:hypothetical protein
MPERTVRRKQVTTDDTRTQTNVPDLVLGADSTGHAYDVVRVCDVVANRFLVVAVILFDRMVN